MDSFLGPGSLFASWSTLPPHVVWGQVFHVGHLKERMDGHLWRLGVRCYSFSGGWGKMASSRPGWVMKWKAWGGHGDNQQNSSEHLLYVWGCRYCADVGGGWSGAKGREGERCGNWLFLAQWCREKRAEVVLITCFFMRLLVVLGLVVILPSRQGHVILLFVFLQPPHS